MGPAVEAGASMKIKGKGGRQPGGEEEEKRRKKDGEEGEAEDEGAPNVVDKLTETWQAFCHSMVAHACNSKKLRQQDLL